MVIRVSLLHLKRSLCRNGAGYKLVLIKAERRGHFPDQSGVKRLHAQVGLACNHDFAQRIGRVYFATCHLRDNGVTAEGNVNFGVAALMDEDEFAVANIGGGFHHQFGHHRECLWGTKHVGQWIKGGCVKAAGDDDDVGCEICERGNDYAFQRFEIGGVTAPGGQWDVDIEAFARFRTAIR